MPKLRIDLEPNARINVVPGEFVVRATFTNTGPDPAQLNLHQASSPSLALQVTDSQGRAVLLPPPPIPDERDFAPLTGIAPRAALEIEYGGFLDRSLPPGVYRVRYFSERRELGGSPNDPAQSPWIEFTVRDTGFPPPSPDPEEIRRRLGRYWPIGRIVPRLRRRPMVPRPGPCNRVVAVGAEKERQETISNSPAGANRDGTFGWISRFELTTDDAECSAKVTVRVRVVGAVTLAERDAWQKAIHDAWSDRFKLCCAGDQCCKDGYTIVADVKFVDAGEHHVVIADAATKAMKIWGRSDTISVRHEFGHMLGAYDEYYTVAQETGAAVDWGQPDPAIGSIMNVQINDPAARHYDLIRDVAQGLLGAPCTVKALAEPC
jgi:hypothetical protein